MDISVIVPIYGVEKHIEKCLVSLFSQTKTDGVEFILINDCTPDRSIEIAQQVSSCYPTLSIKIINKEKNGGLAAARQTGVDVACGEYIQHIDSDDWVEPTLLEDLYKIAKGIDADIITCDYFVNYPNQQVYKSLPAPDSGLGLLKIILSDSTYGSVWNKMIRRSLYTDNDIRVVTPGVNMCEDQIITTKLASCANVVAYVPKAYYHYMQNGDSIIHNIGEKECRNIVSAMSEIEDYLMSKNLADKFRREILLKKLLFKTTLVIQSRGALQIENISIYKDSDAYIWQHPNIRIDNKVILFLASKNQIWLANNVRDLVLFLKKSV